MNIRKIAAVMTVAAMLCETAFASVLGTAPVSLKNTVVSHGTELFENKFMSDQDGVGLQSEYYAEYTPNLDTTPYVTTGKSVFGKRDAFEAAEYMKENGLVPMLGINASYFSLQTGVPMGHVISEGRLLSSDSAEINSLGFMEDGTAFIAPLSVEVMLETEQGSVGISNINKYNVATIPWITLYNSDFGEHTENDVEALSLIIDTKDEKLVNGEKIEAEVVDKFVYTGGLAIEEGKMILSINTDGSYEYHYKLLDSVGVGDKIKLTCHYKGDERWEKAQHAIGSQNEVLLKDGEVAPDLAKGAAPRTAVGITADGNVLFYVIDGRQEGHSYGAKLETVANRLKELGCVDAINFDGGGSSAIVGVYPGAEDMSVINSPSDGRLRSVTNFIFLKNNKKPDGELFGIYVTPQQDKYLTGTKAELSSYGYDKEFYRVDAEDVEFSVSGESVIDGSTVTFIGNEKVEITATSGDVSTVSTNEVYDTPDGIELLVSGENVKTLAVNTDTELELSAEAYIGYTKLIADSDCFAYALEGDIGSIENNIFTARADKTTKGKIIVSAGKKSVEIPVKVINNDYIFGDITEHWAREMIRDMAIEGAVSGYETDESPDPLFMPDNNITRAEFAVLLGKYLMLETADVKEKVFSDEIPQWAEKYIYAMYSLGYVSGKKLADSSVAFAPGDKITRAEAAAIIGRTLMQKDVSGEVEFADSEEIPSWAKAYIERLADEGILSGYADGSVKPLSNVTRAEAVTLLYKLNAVNNIKPEEDIASDDNIIEETQKQDDEIEELIEGIEELVSEIEDEETSAEADAEEAEAQENEDSDTPEIQEIK